MASHAGLLLLSLVALALSPSAFALQSEGFLDLSLSSFPAEALRSFSAQHPLLDAWLNPERHFIEFLKRHTKNYTGADFRHRLEVFKRNILTAAENQLNDPGAEHGVTPFSDMTPEEFAENKLGYLPGVERRSLKDLLKLRGPRDEVADLPTDNLPESLDWREKGAVASVKNQGMCGSCYAFSAVEAVEGSHFLATGKLVDLSEQQVVDCDHTCEGPVCDSGCRGGLMNNVFRYIEDVGGLQTEKDYPYTGRQGKCKFSKNDVVAKVEKFIEVPVKEKQIAAHLVQYGPLAVALNAGWLQSYVRGVSCPLLCSKYALNHGVLLVGYGSHGFAPARLKYKDYWIVKNSWGKGWGEEGFFRICRGRDECGIDTVVSAVVATGVDGQA